MFCVLANMTELRVDPFKINRLIRIATPNPSANSTNKWVNDKRWRFFVITKSTKENKGKKTSFIKKIGQFVRRSCRWVKISFYWKKL